MKCRKCGSTVVLKYTSNLHGVLSKYWECPVCGSKSKTEDENNLGEVVLK